jgi:serine/threonine protein kinase
VSSKKNESQLLFKMMTKTGTVAFSAPEIFMEKFYDEKVDIWSAGTVLYMMLCGEQPYEDGNVANLVRAISSEEPKFKNFNNVSEEAINLIKLMLSKDPKKRPSADECL